MTFLRSIRTFNRDHNIKTAVIDDDPTGCQTVHSVPLLFKWDRETIRKAFEIDDIVFFLTNSRALEAKDAERVNMELAADLLNASGSRWNLRIISRSDSTLRGHFKEEVLALALLTGPYDGVIIAPFFEEGLRFTFNDTHFIRQGEDYIPVSDTEFARDRVFGYPVSNLAEWVEFKTGGFWKKENVLSISIDDIRKRGAEYIAGKLIDAGTLQPVIINALNYRDLEVSVWGICLAESRGKRFLYRTAASFVRVRAGIERRKPLISVDKSPNALIVAGSYTEKTTDQIEELCQTKELLKVEIDLDRIFKEGGRYKEELIKITDGGIAFGRSVLLVTERKYKTLGSVVETQIRSGEISLFLAGIVAGLKHYPGVIIAKGGITSHDVANHGLHIGEARVMGQIEPGVPLLRLSAESRRPGAYYVIFPGNVGDRETLKKIAEKLVY